MLIEQKFNNRDLEENEEIKKIDNPLTKQVAIALHGIVRRTVEKESQFT